MMDDLKLSLMQAGNAIMQKCFYNGWTHDHYVISVFCFCPDGTIPIAFFYVPGSVHDSQVAEFENIYGKLETVFDMTGGKCCVNSVFGDVNRKHLYKSGQALCGWKTLIDCGRQLQHDRHLSGVCSVYKHLFHGCTIGSIMRNMEKKE
jgi:hypothetical protein